jgi:hypothetical protein
MTMCMDGRDRDLCGARLPGAMKNMGHVVRLDE